MSASISKGKPADGKRQSILNTALVHFLKHGFKGTAMAEIPRDADVSTATLYKYHASKDDLFLAVVVEAAENVNESVAPDIGPMPEKATLPEMYSSLLYGFHAAQQKNRVNDLLRIVIAEAKSSPKLALQVFEKVVLARRKNVKAFIDLLVQQGFLKPHDSELGATLAMGMIKELFVWPAIFDANYQLPTDALEQARYIFDIYFAQHGTGKAFFETEGDL
jgi:AcrR family transcriptional regulator